MLKRVMQLNDLKSVDLDEFLFGQDYKPEQNAILSDLYPVFEQKLRIPLE